MVYELFFLLLTYICRGEYLAILMHLIFKEEKKKSIPLTAVYSK